MLSSFVFNNHHHHNQPPPNEGEYNEHYDQRNPNFIRNEESIHKGNEKVLVLLGGTKSSSADDENTSSTSNHVDDQQQSISLPWTKFSSSSSARKGASAAALATNATKTKTKATIMKHVSNTFFRTEEAERSLRHVIQHQPPMLRTLASKWLANAK